jgi:hypothetical protein
MAERSEAQSAKLRVKISRILIFEAKVRFALLASLRSVIFCEIKKNYLLVILHARVNKI